MNRLRLIVAVALSVMVALVAGACADTTETPIAAAKHANFRFLISDDVNAIEDFESVIVSISRIGVQRGGESGNWLEFTPHVTEVDLKPLVGENALEIWSGNITPGEYTKVFIHVSEVGGNLTSALGGGKANIKLPSDKLQITKPFVVSGNTTTTFVYDITVIKAGQSGQYILKPQIAQSGADQEFTEVRPEEAAGEGPGKPEQLEFRGTVETFEGTTWTVNIEGESRTVHVGEAEIEGEPDAGVQVKIEGVEENGDIVADEVTVEEPEEEEPEPEDE